MTTIPSAQNQDPTLHCAYFGGPRDGLKTGDLPAAFSGKNLTGMVSKTPLTQPHEFSLYAVYECVSEAQVNGFWEFEYQGLEGPNGEALGLTKSDPVTEATDPTGWSGGLLETGNVVENDGDSDITTSAFVGVALSSLDQAYIGLYALVQGGGTYIRAGSLWEAVKGAALNKLNGCQLIEIEKDSLSVFDALDTAGQAPTLDQIAALSTSGGPSSWDRQQQSAHSVNSTISTVQEVNSETPRMKDQPRYSCGDMAEFNSLLLGWLAETTERTVGAGVAGTFATVELDGIPCELSAETTRAGVRSYIAQVLSGDTKYSVVASSKGVIHRVAVGQTEKRIPGFYMYTQDQFKTPQIITPVESTAFTASSVARLILEAVGVLHTRGHQRLRVFPNISGSGMSWRLAICSVDTLAGKDWPHRLEPRAMFGYTEADGLEIAGLQVGPSTSADEVADAILNSLSDTGLGRDWAYAGWFAELLGIVRREDCLPVGDEPIAREDGRQYWSFTKQMLMIDEPPRWERTR